MGGAVGVGAGQGGGIGRIGDDAGDHLLALDRIDGELTHPGDELGRLKRDDRTIGDQAARQLGGLKGDALADGGLNRLGHLREMIRHGCRQSQETQVPESEQSGQQAQLAIR